MNIERRAFENDGVPEEPDDLDARIEALAEAAMRDPVYAARFGPEGDEAADLRAQADVAAGRCIPHEKVAEWLRTWGTPDFKSMPREWLE